MENRHRASKARPMVIGNGFTRDSDDESHSSSSPGTSDDEVDRHEAEGSQSDEDLVRSRRSNQAVSEDERNSGVSTDSGSTSSDAENSEGEIDTVAFIKQYNALTRAAKRLGNDLDIAEDFEGGSVMVIDNVEDGEKLATKIGYDPSKAVSAFTHALAIAETANRNVKKCGNTSSLFSIEKYLDVMRAMSMDERGDYDSSKAHSILEEDANCFCVGYSLTTLQDVVEFSKTIQVVEKPKRKANRTRATFDDTVPPTQHEVVNSTVLNRQDDSEKDSLTKSLRQADEIRKICKKSKQTALGIFDYGLRGTRTPQNFIKQVFDAAVITRDGCAEIFDQDADVKNECPSGSPNGSYMLRAARPPSVNENGFDINRSQYILRLNSATLKKLLESVN